MNIHISHIEAIFVYGWTQIKFDGVVAKLKSINWHLLMQNVQNKLKHQKIKQDKVCMGKFLLYYLWPCLLHTCSLLKSSGDKLASGISGWCRLTYVPSGLESQTPRLKVMRTNHLEERIFPWPNGMGAWCIGVQWQEHQLRHLFPSFHELRLQHEEPMDPRLVLKEEELYWSHSGGNVVTTENINNKKPVEWRKIKSNQILFI